MAESAHTSAGKVLSCALPGTNDALYRQDVSGCLETTVAEGGLSSGQLDTWLEKADAALGGLKSEFERGSLSLLGTGIDADAVEAAYARLSVDAGTIIFLGAGGASLGAQAIAQFGGWGIPGTTTAEQRQRPTTRFYDNLDAETLGALLSAPRLDRFRFVVVSTSGNTPDTLAQAVAALAAVRAGGLEARIPEMFLGITEPAVAGRRNGLRDLLAYCGAPILDHSAGLPGRFGALATAGLIAAVSRGVDPRQLLAGAAAVTTQLARAAHACEVPAAVGAAIVTGLPDAVGIRGHVILAYADRLMKFAHWYAQLSVAGLGKDGKGTMPIAGGGPVDQPGLLQMMLHGAGMPMATLLTVPSAQSGPLLATDLAERAGISEMAGRRVAELVAAEAEVMIDALREAGRPVRTLELVRDDAFGLGALLMHFMIEVILAASIMEVDPFDQPAVELSERLARERLAGTR